MGLAPAQIDYWTVWVLKSAHLAPAITSQRLQRLDTNPFIGELLLEQEVKCPLWKNKTM